MTDANNSEDNLDVDGSIEDQLRRAQEDLREQAGKKAASAIKEAINPPTYKQPTLYAGAGAGAVGMLILTGIFGGDNISQSDHDDIVKGLKEQITKVSEQLTEANQKLAQKPGTQVVISNPFRTDTTAMICNDEDGNRVMSLPLEYTDRLSELQYKETFNDARASRYIGPESCLGFDGEARWAIEGQGKYPGVRISGYVDQFEIKTDEHIDLMHEGMRKARSDVSNYPDTKIAYRFQVIAGQDATSSTAAKPPVLKLIRDMEDDKKKGATAGDWETIYSHELN